MNLRARIPWWCYAVLAIAVAALFVRLAVWQYHRAREREAIIRAADHAVHSPSVPLDAARAAALPRFMHVRVEGRYDGGRQVLLSERPRPGGGATGLEVLTPLRLAGGQTLLVDRGWVPAAGPGKPAADLAAPPGSVSASGYLADLPSPGLRLGGSVDRSGEWPAVMLYPRWPDLERLYGGRLVHRLLLLEPDAAGGYLRDWRLRPEHGPGENYSYMLQWLGMAAAVLVLWAVLEVRRRRRRKRGAT